MQIQDFIGQLGSYMTSGNKNTSIKRSGESGSVKESALIAKGQIFEGSVSSIDGKKVTLSLPNGQTMTARLEGNVSLEEGTSVFFQVKSNDGKTIEITPLQNGNINNPILLNALSEAALPQTGRNIELVNTLMQNNLPINADNLARMGRLASSHSDVDIMTLIRMDQFGIEPTPENIDNFVRFEENSNAILEDVKNFVSSLPEALASLNLSKTDIIEIQQAIIDVSNYKLDGEAPVNGELPIDQEVVEMDNMTRNPEAESTVSSEKAAVSTPEENLQSKLQASDSLEAELAMNQGEKVSSESGEKAAASNANESVVNPNAQDEAVVVTESKAGETSVRTEAFSQRQELATELKNVPGFMEANPQLFDEKGNLKADIPDRQILTALNDFLKNNPDISKSMIKDIFSGKGYQSALSNVLESEWLMKPDEVSLKDSIRKMYEKIERQISNLDKVARAIAGENNPISDSLKGVKSNIDFMNQINQLYSYVQIPLRMANQSATGDLYVYSRKKKGQGESDDISAFLHLSLNHLGNTDIAVTMHKKQVGIRFYLDDPISYQLVNDNLDKLDDKLRAKGYIPNILLTDTPCEENLALKMLDSNTVNTEQKIKRYSFDVRA